MMIVSTSFAFDLVENSTRTTVDGDDIGVAFSKDLQRETPELVVRLRHSYTINTPVLRAQYSHFFPSVKCATTRAYTTRSCQRVLCHES